jgi:HAD superfamily hydrolase (TIGR01509 family)
MLLIFDCDGVILDSMPLHTEVESAFYRSRGINITPQELGRRFSGVPLVEEFKILEQETGRKLPPELEIEITAMKKDIFARRLQVVDGIEEVLEKLEDVPRCIATGMRLGELDHALNIVNLYSTFAPHLFSSEMVSKGKPFPDLFLHAAQQMNQQPKDCLVIEDGVPGVQAGRAAGMRVLGFVGGSHCDDEHGDRLREAGADLVFAAMRELPGLIGR